MINLNVLKGYFFPYSTHAKKIFDEETNKRLRKEILIKGERMKIEFYNAEDGDEKIKEFDATDQEAIMYLTSTDIFLDGVLYMKVRTILNRDRNELWILLKKHK